ncbi:MAG: hypothetical protein QM777_22650 [Pseudorhodoferax sp.]
MLIDFCVDIRRAPERGLMRAALRMSRVAVHSDDGHEPAVAILAAAVLIAINGTGHSWFMARRCPAWRR